MNRRLTHIHDSHPTADGDGVKIFRNIAGGSLSDFDPFLLLDELYSDDPADYIGGFPEHPHRGFETVTYMLEGSMKHKDHMGNEGLLEPGSVQWMTAGRGVLHSEMPLQDEGRLHGFQLWVNLPANEKMRPADYQELPKEKIPVITIGERSYVKVIAGAFNRNGSIVSGPITGVTTAPDYFDIFLGEGDTVDVTTEKNKRVLIYVYEGLAIIEDKSLNAKQLGTLSEGDSVLITAGQQSRLLFLAGIPIKEPIVNWGPFVMNTREEIEQAVKDFQTDKLVSVAK